MESVANTVISVFWFFLPAGIANMAPVLFTWLPWLNQPVDFNKQLWGKPIFGQNKTYRGFLVGIIFAVLTVYLQQLIYPESKGHTLLNYEQTNSLYLGFLLGFGALGGDLFKSFIKRRLKIPVGWVWAPFDQVDWILGAVLLSSLVVDFQITDIIVVVIIFGLLHPIINLVGYALHIKANKF